jgi:hypothetical protein
MDTGAKHYSAYLISEKYNEFNYKNYLKNHYLDIFEEELYSMIRDLGLWPQTMDYKTYNEWFDTRINVSASDLRQEPSAVVPHAWDLCGGCRVTGIPTATFIFTFNFSFIIIGQI